TIDDHPRTIPGKTGTDGPGVRCNDCPCDRQQPPSIALWRISDMRRFTMLPMLAATLLLAACSGSATSAPAASSGAGGASAPAASSGAGGASAPAASAAGGGAACAAAPSGGTAAVTVTIK